ncbi:hypothetical protein KKA03_03940, partial [archaeon]|nr:hypothetical protein [archaeon]
MKKWALFFYASLFFSLICIQGAYAIDEIISYEHIGGKTEFLFYQHDGTSFTREADASHFDITTGWLTGDTDGDGVDELISYEHVGSKTEFLFYQQEGTSLTREAAISHFDITTGWLTGDTDGDGVDELISYEHIGGKT